MYQPQQQQPMQQQGGGFNPTQQQAAAPQTQPAVNPAFVQGGQAQAAMQQAMAKQEALGNRTFRFSIKWLANQQQPEHLITFLDGNLTQDGFLDCLCLNEHRVVIDGKPTQVTCTEPRESCPVCKAAEEQNNRNYNRAAFTGFLTVIDHTGYVDNQGVHHRDIIRLYPAKTKQMQLLIKMAQQYGTLRGVSFKVSRSSDKAAGVGDIMIPQGQADLNQLAQWWAQTYQDRGQLAPLDYNKELPYYDAAKLSQMCGFGMSHGQFGGGSQMPAYNPQQQYGAPQQPQQQPAYQPPQMAAQQPAQQQPMQQNQMPQYQNQPQQQAYNPAQQQPAQQQYQPPVQQQAPVQNQQPAYNPAQQAPAQQQAPIQQQPAQQQVPDHAPGLEPQNPMQQYQQNAPAQQQQQAPVQQQQAPVQQQNMAGTNPDYSGQL